MRRFPITILMIAALMVFSLNRLPSPLSAQASTLTVTKLTDTNDAVCDADCSLREAIATAPGGATVNFASGLSGTIVLGGTELAINQSLTIAGPSDNSIAVSGNNVSRVLNIATGATVTISNLTFENGMINISSTPGAGIYNAGTLNLSASTITGNSTTGLQDVGTGIYNGSTASVNITNSIISNNTMSSSFAASGGGGGGLYNDGSATITGSTFSGNGLKWIGAPINNANGTAIHNSATGNMTISRTSIFGNGGTSSAPANGCRGAGIYNEGTLTITNSTISGNSYPSVCNDVGGALYNFGTLTLTSSSIANNHASAAGGISNISTLNMATTIVAGNTAITHPDIEGTINSQDYNLVQNTTGATFTGTTTHNIYGVDPLLGPLQDNGGPTQTQALQTGSPAIDQIPWSACQAGTDQRGFRRPINLLCEIGAFEYGSSAPLLSHPQVIGIYNTADGQFYVSSDNVNILSHFVWGPGNPWAAIEGDWDGNGTDTIGLYNTADGEFYLTNNNSTVAQHFVWGPGSTWKAIVGDWDGNGIDTIGLYNTADGEFYLTNNNSTVAQHFVWGPGGTWAAIVGDWDGNGTDTIGLYNTADGEFYLTNNNSTVAQHFIWGPGGTWVAIVGYWGGGTGSMPPPLWQGQPVPTTPNSAPTFVPKQ